LLKFLREIGWFFSGAIGWFVKIIATILVVAIVTTTICTTVFALYIDRYIKPAIENVDISDMTLNYTSFVYATDPTTGQEIELEQLYDENNRVWIDYEDIPKNMMNALVAIEDSRFYEHKGVDWVRTAGAMINMIIPIRDNFGGGSTITQQLIKNLTGEKDVTVQRKLQEILRALEFEKQYTKEDILELYLNIVYFGRGSYGVETAAQTYFRKSASELSLAESAAIVGITNSPTYYDPVLRPENNKKRQELILRLMLEQGYITQKEHDAAVAEKLDITPYEELNVDNQPKQSYYVDQVITDVLADLQSELGYSAQAASNLLFSGGLKIYACVDLRIQAILDDVYQNDEDFPQTRDAKQPESAMVILSADDSRVLAMVGGRGEKKVNRAWNRATMTTRSPGSAIKPLTVYAPAIEYGFITSATVFDDSPFDEETMYPKNQSRGYTGRMTVKKALQKSTNTVAMKVLDLVTLERSFNFATVNLGLDLVRSETINDRVFTDVGYAPLSLGGLTYGVSVLDITAAYAAFPNRGIYTEPRTYTKVLDSAGNVLLENEPVSQVAMQEKTAYYMNNLLRSVVDSGTGTLAKIPNIAVAGKTGTTNDDYDRWFVGYTPDYVAAVWFGYDTQKEIKMETSRNPSVEIWQKVMSQVVAGHYYESFFTLDNVQASYCLDSGLAPSQYCSLDPRGSRVTSGTFLKEDVPTKKCNVHVPISICSESGMRSNAFCPSDSVVTISLIDVDRTGKVAMSDDAYLYSDIVAVTDDTDATAYNTYCTLHKQVEVVEPEDWPGGEWIEDWFVDGNTPVDDEPPEVTFPDEILPGDSMTDIPIE